MTEKIKACPRCGGRILVRISSNGAVRLIECNPYYKPKKEKT